MNPSVKNSVALVAFLLGIIGSDWVGPSRADTAFCVKPIQNSAEIALGVWLALWMVQGVVWLGRRPKKVQTGVAVGFP